MAFVVSPSPSVSPWLAAIRGVQDGARKGTARLYFQLTLPRPRHGGVHQPVPHAGAAKRPIDLHIVDGHYFVLSERVGEIPEPLAGLFECKHVALWLMTDGCV